eukprot:2711678-Pleurochrysis_carterae.AAC.1
MRTMRKPFWRVEKERWRAWKCQKLKPQQHQPRILTFVIVCRRLGLAGIRLSPRIYYGCTVRVQGAFFAQLAWYVFVALSTFEVAR